MWELFGYKRHYRTSLFEINRNGKEILIPVNDHFILKVDRTSKIIYLDVPEGLIELYL